MIKNIKLNCSGCAACASACSKNAITMQLNEEGFLYPEINEEICINCGLCEKICPVINPIYKNTKKPKCYAAMASDVIREHSSSGGIFPLLAYYFLKNNGYVAGAVWNKEGKVKHIVSNKKEDIDAMKGSKYLQSEINDCYTKIKYLLDAGNKILFTGTPCQVAGLYAFLCKNYENLFTVELICHGVPSAKIFKKYLTEHLENNEKFVKTDFRDKAKGWNPTSFISTVFSSGRKILLPSTEDEYMQAFLKNLSLRQSCGNCVFNKLPRQADMTIGDFWRICKYNKKYDDQKGTSVILINNPKGNNLLENISNSIKMLKKVPLRYAIKGNPMIIRPSSHNHYRKNFFEKLKTQTLKQTVNMYNPDKCDYLIVNFWDTYDNYGALLTAYALQQLIMSFGFTTKLLDTGERTEDLKYKGTFAADFVRKYLYKTNKLSFKKAEKYVQNIKGAILGSDQVLRLHFMGKNYKKYLLTFVNKECRKIAISPSFGFDKEDFLKDKYSTKKNIKMMQKGLQDFDYLSCREISGKNIYKDIFGLESDMILDPVFMIDKLEYDHISNTVQDVASGKIVHYILDKNNSYNKIFEYLSKKFHAEILPLDRSTGKVTVPDWLNAIKNCKFFLTDSFHGACFALIFNKPFICLKNTKRGNARFDSLIELFELKDNFIASLDEINNFDLNPDWEKINLILATEKDRCLDILKKVFFEEYSNNKRQTYKFKDISYFIKIHLYLKMFLYKLLTFISGKNKEKYNQKINKIKHLKWRI